MEFPVEAGGWLWNSHGETDNNHNKFSWFSYPVGLTPKRNHVTLFYPKLFGRNNTSFVMAVVKTEVSATFLTTL